MRESHPTQAVHHSIPPQTHDTYDRSIREFICGGASFCAYINGTDVIYAVDQTNAYTHKFSD